jgi:hypothetical protein
VERIPPIAGFARVGLLNKRLRLLEATMVFDPDTGGWVPGDPKLLATVWGAIEPNMLSRLQKEAIAGGGQLANVETSRVTCWYVAGVTVNHWVEYDSVTYPPPADGSAPPVTLRHFEILEVRQVYEDYRVLELLCKERVS